MVTSSGSDLRELAWTVAGALAGSLLRHWVDPFWPGTTRALPSTFILTCAAAALVGFACAAPLGRPLKTLLAAAGGAAGSISVMATRAASATPTAAIIGLGIFVSATLASLLLGMLVTVAAGSRARQKRL